MRCNYRASKGYRTASTLGSSQHCIGPRHPFLRGSTLNPGLSSLNNRLYNSNRTAGKLLEITCAAPSDSTGGPSSSGRITDPYKKAKDELINKYPPNGNGSDPNGSPAASSSQQTPTASGGSSQTSISPNGSSPASTNNGTSAAGLEPGTWEWWTAYFNCLDDAVHELSGIENELQDAVAEEDYGRAAALQAEMTRMEKMDVVGSVLDDMEAALAEERYGDASILRDAGGIGMLGWWVGRAGEDDDQGHLVKITPEFGRYVGTAYSAREIADLAGWIGEAPSLQGPAGAGGMINLNKETMMSGSGDNEEDRMESGQPVFEVFIRKDDGVVGGLMQQAAALHAPASAVALQAAAEVESITNLLAAQIEEGGTVISVEKGKDENGVGYVRINLSPSASKGKKGDDDSSSSGSSEDGDANGDEDDSERNAQARLENMNADIVSGSLAADDDDDEGFSIDELAAMVPHGRIEIVHGEDGEVSISFQSENYEDSSSDEEGIDPVTNDTDMPDDDQEESNEEGSHNDDQPSTISEMGLGAVLQRCPAAIEWQGRDAFILEVTPLTEQQEAQEREAAAASSSNIRVLASSSGSLVTEIPVISSSSEEEEEEEDDARSKDISGNTTTESKKAGTNTAKKSPLESLEETFLGQGLGRSITESMTALEEASSSLVRLGLEGEVRYTRIMDLGAKTDTLSGVYVGSFGPHGPELLQLSRVMIEGEEWVLGTKLTGDANVPSGETSFRARIGKEHRIPVSSVYPPELGVMQRYEGQGRVAQEGYKNPKWVDGELLTLTASNPILPGATLGFVFNMDGSRKFLVMFTKIHLDELKV